MRCRADALNLETETPCTFDANGKPVEQVRRFFHAFLHLLLWLYLDSIAGDDAVNAKLAFLRHLAREPADLFRYDRLCCGKPHLGNQLAIVLAASLETTPVFIIDVEIESHRPIRGCAAFLDRDRASILIKLGEIKPKLRCAQRSVENSFRWNVEHVAFVFHPRGNLLARLQP